MPTSKLRFACASCSETAAFCAIDQLDVELREQHVEVRDCDADDQVLLRRGERVVGLLDLALRLVVREHVLRAVDRLRRADRDAVVLEVAAREHRRRAARVAVDVVRVDRARQRDVRQQRGARLRRALLRGEPARARGGERRVVALRLAVDLHQVLGRRRRAQAKRSGTARASSASFHRCLPSLVCFGQYRASAGRRRRPRPRRRRRLYTGRSRPARNRAAMRLRTPWWQTTTTSRSRGSSARRARQLAHRHVQRVGQRAALEFPGLAHVDQQRRGRGRVGEPAASSAGASSRIKTRTAPAQAR